MELSTSHCYYQHLRNLITRDEKSMLHINNGRRHQRLSTGQTGVTTSKTNLHTKLIMLIVWQRVKEIIHWEILPNVCSVPSSLCCQKLNRVGEKFQRRQDRTYFLGDLM